MIVILADIRNYLFGNYDVGNLCRIIFPAYYFLMPFLGTTNTDADYQKWNCSRDKKLNIKIVDIYQDYRSEFDIKSPYLAGLLIWEMRSLKFIGEMVQEFSVGDLASIPLLTIASCVVLALRG